MPERSDLMWKVSALAAGVGAATLTTRLVALLWREVTGAAPPPDRAADTRTGMETAMWVVAVGVAGALARHAAQRGAAEAWKRTTGDYPPALAKHRDSW